MDCIKIGKIIHRLRKEKKLTQKELAQLLNVSDKTVSKWERGLGCPDVSLWSSLSDALGADMRKLMEGELYPKDADSGNLRKMNFYVCKECGNVMTSTSHCSISCCGRQLSKLKVHQTTTQHHMEVNLRDDRYDVKFNHEMTKSHYILFVAFVSDASLYLNRLYPEQEAMTSFPALLGQGTLYAYCSQDGLWKERINRKELIKNENI